MVEGPAVPALWRTLSLDGLRFRAPALPELSEALLNAEEYSDLGSILRACGRIAPHFELVREQRRKAHNVGTNAQEHRDVVTECAQGPVASTVLDQGV
jgi:hypothetical protein